ncbi:hypothetical protein M405DRAFT_747439 [Rhizopogon salebrosus TDB-379]|nr:hypothetical protein M405DRAFT_747439 [Rhizopogon salebrosus TDB-379]
MPLAAAYRKQGTKDRAREAVIKEAVDGVKSKKYANPRQAAELLGIQNQYHTIWRRLNGKTKPRVKAHMNHQLLNTSQETVLRNWIKWLGFTGIPLTKRTIGLKVEALCGRKPSRRWIYRFLRRNPDCTLGRPAGLDPKRARHFNYTTVNKHFEKLQGVFDKDDIPLCNVLNVDEIGVQLGGGRKGTGEQCLFAHMDKSRYKIKSDDLELVTILESVCADGTAPVKPCFVFAGTNHCDTWYEEDGIL